MEQEEMNALEAFCRQVEGLRPQHKVVITHDSTLKSWEVFWRAQNGALMNGIGSTLSGAMRVAKKVENVTTI